ncbi:nucleic acid binding protein [Striga asiatica]|uniref:Nucleic acid binding protein n=1 Tax=Striga asiatica TaxID=4170 RepID=A0A5A7QD19_STRAF|nr:nucleic acid binding protein [Striga asiatica]
MGANKRRPEDESGSEPDPDSDSGKDEDSRKSDGGRKRTKGGKSKTRSSNSKRRRSRESDSYSSSSSEYESDSSSESEFSDSEEERRRRRRERRRREEKKEKRRREKERSRKRKRKEDDRKKKKKKDKKEKDKGQKGAVTNSWGKYGIIRETDMCYGYICGENKTPLGDCKIGVRNKRPEFTAWLAEIKKIVLRLNNLIFLEQVNLESLPNWEEKQLFKDFMEDHNTATFPSKKYYNLDAYYQRKMEKEMKKGYTKAVESERTVFNDEEQRRLELQQERERRKQQEVEDLKRSMQSGMAQAMKEQAQLREEMAYQYKIGNFEAAAAIQKRLDPDVAM